MSERRRGDVIFTLWPRRLEPVPSLSMVILVLSGPFLIVPGSGCIDRDRPARALDAQVDQALVDQGVVDIARKEAAWPEASGPDLVKIPDQGPDLPFTKCPFSGYQPLCQVLKSGAQCCASSGMVWDYHCPPGYGCGPVFDCWDADPKPCAIGAFCLSMSKCSCAPSQGSCSYCATCTPTCPAAIPICPKKP